MIMRFRNRTVAGQMLAEKLTRYADRPDVTVLALPRGGVPVGYEVAQALHVPLDVFMVRKLGVPGNEELAMGAIASGGVRVLNGQILEERQITDPMIEAVAGRELAELERRERAYRGNAPPVDVAGRTIVLVDDGIATGATVRAAVAALRQAEAARIVVAVPTAALSTVRSLRQEADEMVAVMTPADFSCVGEWYEHFDQVTDEEVRARLQPRQEPAA